MSGTEDYLDKLLNSVVDKEGGPADPQGAAPDSDDDFMKGFENDFYPGMTRMIFSGSSNRNLRRKRKNRGPELFRRRMICLTVLTGL